MSGTITINSTDLANAVKPQLLQMPEITRQPYSYIIYTDGTTVYAKNGYTGQIDFKGSDASTVIQHALDSLTPDRTWKETVIIKGNLIIRTTISIHSYTRVLINGKLQLQTGATYSTINIYGANDVEIIGGIVDGNMEGMTSNEALIVVDSSDNITIRDMAIINFPKRGIMITNSKNINVKNIYLENQGTGLIDYGWGINTANVKNCIIENVLGKNVRNHVIDAGGENISIKNVFALNAYGALVVFGKNILVENIFAEMITNDYYAIVVGSDIASYTRSNNIVVKNSYIYFGRGGIFVQQTEQSSILNNFIFGTRNDAGIVISQVNAGNDNIEIQGNTVYNCLVGIYVTGNNHKITKNNVINSDNEGIYLHGAKNVDIDGNLVIKNGKDGIFVTNNSSSVNIRFNIVYNNNQNNDPYENAGIDIYNSNLVSVIGNIVFDDEQIKKQQYGIKIGGSSDYYIVKDNIVQGNAVAQIAIFAYGSNRIIYDNIGYQTRNSGQAVFNGDGVTTQFMIPHSLASMPSKILVTPGSSDANGALYVTADSTYIYVNYATAPPTGTNNVVLYWYAEV